jgi:hypothetical protein
MYLIEASWDHSTIVHRRYDQRGISREHLGDVDDLINQDQRQIASSVIVVLLAGDCCRRRARESMEVYSFFANPIGGIPLTTQPIDH